MTVVTRFAPSPTGELHLGSVYSAWVCRRRARDAGGTFLLRIEDIDIRRCRREYETAILADLTWLGLGWDGTVRRQSEHFAEYGRVLDILDARGLIYPCFCTRSDIAASSNAPHASLQGPDGPLYPGTCRSLSSEERRDRVAAGIEHCLRLDAAKAAREAGPYFFIDEKRGRIAGEPLLFGDVVLARKDTPTSYHLSVTHDDHLQGITLVTRGEDLLPSTHVHVLLQKLLRYATPAYAHHRILTAPDGKRLAKRDRSLAIRSLRDGGRTPEEVFSLLPKD
jgi:glutamyl-Q tRNA(Asp) synthetase